MLNEQPNFISSRHYVQLAEELINIGFWNAEMTSGEILATDGFLRVMDLAKSETLTVHRWISLFHPDDREELRSIFSLSSTGVAMSRDLRVMRDNHAPRWIRVAAERSILTNRLVGLVQDLTGEHEARAATHRERARLSAFLEATRGVFWTINPAGALIDLAGWEAITGQIIDECRNNGWITMIHPEEQGRILTTWSTCLREQTPFESEFRLYHRDGSYRPVLARCLPVLNEKGATIEWLGVLQERWGPNAVKSNHGGIAVLKPQQLRAARAMLGWSAAKLAFEAGVSAATISRYESSDEHMKEGTIVAIVAALERHGIVMTRSAEEIGITLRIPSNIASLE